MSADLKIPVIKTERLKLRAHRLEDFPAIRDMWRDPQVTRYIGGKPRPEEEVWLKFLRNAGFWTHFGYGYWVIEEKKSGAVVGETGFGEFKRDLSPPIKGEPEMGWALAAPFHGKGYASEAALAAVAWGDDHLGGARMSCIVSPENAPSIRIAEKCGFKKTGEAVYHGDDVLVFHRG